VLKFTSSNYSQDAIPCEFQNGGSLMFLVVNMSHSKLQVDEKNELAPWQGSAPVGIFIFSKLNNGDLFCQQRPCQRLCNTSGSIANDLRGVNGTGLRPLHTYCTTGTSRLACSLILYNIFMHRSFDISEDLSDISWLITLVTY
jgi:hypothetical protein